MSVTSSDSTESSADADLEASTDEPADTEEVAAEDDATDESGESDDSSETASALAGVDDGSSSTWIAPAIIAAIAVVGGSAFFVRRDNSDS